MLLFAVGAAWPLRATATATELQPWRGNRQPAFALPDTNGVNISLEAARGQVVLVHFFATWCEPCREELPALNRLTARANGAIKVLAISVAEVDPRVRRFIESTPVNFPVLLDRDRAVAKAWDVSTLPTTVALDTNLRPRFVVEADFAWDSIDPAKLVAGLIDDKGTQLTKPTEKTNVGG